MAKKAVATLRSLDKTYSKIIRMKLLFPPTRFKNILLRDK